MSQSNLTLKISFESLIDTISNLSIEDKQKLWEILDEQLHPSQPEDDYDWGKEGQPETKPVEYIQGQGLIVIGVKSDPK